MDKLNLIKKIKIPNKEKLRNLTPDEIIMIVIKTLKDNKIEVLYENVTALAFIEVPHVFSLLGYPSFPDGKRVHDCLFHLGPHGKRLIMGSRQKGFDFSGLGKLKLNEIYNKLNESSASETAEDALPKTKETKMVKWIKSTSAYKKFVSNEEITDYEIRNLLRGTHLSTAEYLEKNWDAYKGYALVVNDNDVLKFLNYIKKEGAHLFKRKKLRGKK